MGQEHDITLPKIQMAFACEGVSNDMFQRVSFNNVIDQLNAVSFPVTTPQLFVVFGFEASIPGILSDVNVIIESPSGGDPVIKARLNDVPLTPDRPYARLVSGFGGIVWPAPGRYPVKLTCGKRVLASFTLDVTKADPAQFKQGAM